MADPQPSYLFVSGTMLFSPHSLQLSALPFDWAQASKFGAQSGANHAAVAGLPNTQGFSEAQLYDTYAPFVRKNGSLQAQLALAAGDQVIVALRIPVNTRVNKGRGVYDDRMAIVWVEQGKSAPSNGAVLLPTSFFSNQPRQQSPILSLARPAPANTCTAGDSIDPSIVKHGADFTANTQPSAQYEDPGVSWKEVKSKKTGKVIRVKVIDKVVGPDGQEVLTKPAAKWEGEDMKNEGRKALGELVPGTYVFHAMDKTFLGAKYLGSSNDQAVYRDVNHDGVFTDADVWHTAEGDTVIEHGDFGIYIHRGGENNTWSAACQTLPPAEHTRFFATLNKKQKNFYYVLVTIQ